MMTKEKFVVRHIGRSTWQGPASEAPGSVKRERCLALQYSDQMNCARCNLAWDMNDPEPPECGKRR